MNNSGQKLNNDTKQFKDLKTLSSVFSTLLLMLLCSYISLYSVSAKAQELVDDTYSKEPLEQTLNADNPPVAPEAEGTPAERDIKEKFNQKVAALTEERARLESTYYKFTPTPVTNTAIDVSASMDDFKDERTPQQEAAYAQADAIVEQYNNHNNESENYDNQRSEAMIAFVFIIILFIIFMIIVLNYYKKLKPKIESTINERQTSKAYDELLKYKKLFDENLISKEEFENRSREIKSKIPDQRS